MLSSEDEVDVACFLKQDFLLVTDDLVSPSLTNYLQDGNVSKLILIFGPN